MSAVRRVEWSQSASTALVLGLQAAATAAAIAESAAGQQHDEDDDEQDGEHGHLPWHRELGLTMYRLFSLREVRSRTWTDVRACVINVTLAPQRRRYGRVQRG